MITALQRILPGQTVLTVSNQGSLYHYLYSPSSENTYITSDPDVSREVQQINMTLDEDLRRMVAVDPTVADVDTRRNIEKRNLSGGSLKAKWLQGQSLQVQSNEGSNYKKLWYPSTAIQSADLHFDLQRNNESDQVVDVDLNRNLVTFDTGTINVDTSRPVNSYPAVLDQSVLPGKANFVIKDMIWLPSGNATAVDIIVDAFRERVENTEVFFDLMREAGPFTINLNIDVRRNVQTQSKQNVFWPEWDGVLPGKKLLVVNRQNLLVRRLYKMLSYDLQTKLTSTYHVGGLIKHYFGSSYNIEKPDNHVYSSIVGTYQIKEQRFCVYNNLKSFYQIICPVAPKVKTVHRDLIDNSNVVGTNNYGGIDTEEERRAIEYRPNIKRSKKAPVVDITNPMYDTVDVEEVESNTPVSDSIQMVVLTRSRLNELIKLAESQLATKVIKIDPDEYPYVSEAIKNVCVLNKNEEGIIYNDDKINFNIYRNCLKSDDSFSSIVVDYWEEAMEGVEGCVAGEMYDLLLKMQRSYEDLEEFLLEQVEAQRDVLDKEKNQKSRLKAATEEQRLAEAKAQEEDYEKYYNGLVDKLSTLSPDSEEFRKTKEKLDNLLPPEETLGNFARLAYERADAADALLDKIEWGMMATAADNFSGMLCCLVRRLFGEIIGIEDLSSNSDETSVLVDTETRMNEAFDKLSNMLDNMEKLILFSMSDVSTANKVINDKINGVLDGAVSSIRNVVAGTLNQARSYINRPVVNWLDTLVSDNEDCPPIEQLADMIMDAIDQVEDKYTQQIVDLFRTQSFEVKVMNERVDNMYSSKWARDSYHTLDAMKESLDSARAWAVKGQVKKWVEEFMRTNNLDTTYDQAEKVIKKITEFDCNGLSGG